MNDGLFATWVVVGLLTGWLAGIVMKEGGHGLVRDLILALIGSSAAGGAWAALDVTSETGPFAMALVAFLGAALVIVGQRKIWYGPA